MFREDGGLNHCNLFYSGADFLHHDEMNDANVSHPHERVADAWMKWRTGARGAAIKDMSFRCGTCTNSKTSDPETEEGSSHT